MECRLFLDVVVAQSTSILKLLASKDESLLVWGDAFLVLDFGLDVFDGITCLDFKGDGFSSECLDEDLHATTQTTEDKVECRLFLDVVVTQSTAILKLLASKDESLLVRGDAFLVLDFGLDVFDGIAGLDLKGDGLSSECLDEDLHATTQTKDEVEGGLLLDVVVTQSTSILKLLASKDESLLVWGDAFLVLDFGLDVFDGITCLDFKGDGLSSECLDEDLHATTQTKH